jgi:Tfp pilus assembly protein PilF
MKVFTIQHSAFSTQHSRRWLPAAVLVAAGVAAYANGFGSGFVGLDAKESIRDNPYIRQLWPLSAAMSLALVEDTLAADAGSKGGTVVRRPILSLSFALDYQLWGLDPWGYHLGNLVIHLGAALVLFGLVRRTVAVWQAGESPSVPSGARRQPRAEVLPGGPPPHLPHSRKRSWGRKRSAVAASEGHPLGSGPHAAATPLALAVALLWLVHPLQTESVTYVVQRGEALMGLWFLLTLYCALRGATGPAPGPWYAGAIAACALGMGTKEVMAVAPLVVLLFDRTFLAGSFRAAGRARWPLYAGLALTWGILLALLLWTLDDAGKDFEGARLGPYALAQPRVLLHYLRLALWPQPLHVYVNTQVFAVRPGLTPEILGPTLALAGLAGLTLWGVARRHWLGFLGVWFFLILAPSSLVATSDLIQEHRLYLPLAAVVALAVLAGDHLLGTWLRLAPPARRAAGTAAVALVALAYTALCIDRNRDYFDEFSFVHPADRLNAQTILIHHEAAQGDLPAAVAIFDSALGRLPTPADQAKAAYALANVFAMHGQLERAGEYYNRAIETHPALELAHNNLGALFVLHGRWDDAQRALAEAVRHRPGFVQAHHNLGLVYARRGDLLHAEEHLERAVQLVPAFEEARKNLHFVRTQRENDGMPAFDLVLSIPSDYGDGVIRLHRAAPGSAGATVQD